MGVGPLAGPEMIAVNVNPEPMVTVVVLVVTTTVGMYLETEVVEDVGVELIAL